MFLYPGAQLERPPGNKYVRALPFAEMVFRGPRPKLATLARFRRGLPEGFQIAVVAPRATLVSPSGVMRPGSELDAGIAWLSGMQEALDAHIVVPTWGLSTSKKDRSRLAEVFERLQNDRNVIWAPGGLWETDLAHPFARELGIVCAYDPLSDDFPGGDTAYARLAAIGLRQRFSEGLLEEILDSLTDSGAKDAYVALESERSFLEAKNLLRIASGE